MRVLEDLKGGERENYIVETYNSLPFRAKELMFAAIKELSAIDTETLGDYFRYGMSDYSQCKSPIEKILLVAIDFVTLERIGEIPTLADIEPQYMIKDGDKIYFADFFLLFEHIDWIKIVVECDGHEFHQKTKKQVEHDNEREMRLKLLGYDVLRFSGSQIYKNPMKCANDIVDYVLTKIK